MLMLKVSESFPGSPLSHTFTWKPNDPLPLTVAVPRIRAQLPLTTTEVIEVLFTIRLSVP
jgi:hypothetical protein